MKVTVNKKGAKRVRQGHLWIFRSDLLKVEALGGSVVRVLDEAKNFVGMAFYSDKSEISLRIISTKDELIDRSFWQKRFADAKNRRSSLPSTANAYRFINSEADLIPSLIIDFYDNFWVLQTLSQGTESLKNIFVDILKEDYEPRAIIERNDVKVRDLENLPQTSGVLYGETPDEIVINHHDIKFYVSLLDGQKTGSFLDQRENHFAVRNYAFGKALDCFTFNGGFALNLAKKCDAVTALDISADAVKLAERNAQLNDFKHIRFETANVFDKLREFEKSGEKFDTIVLDPPAFVKNRSALKGAIRGYKEINLRALKLLNKNGILVSCSCSYHLTESLLLEVVEEASRDAKRRLQLLEKRTQALDHPILLGMPESYYLKCLILQVID